MWAYYKILRNFQLLTICQQLRSIFFRLLVELFPVVEIHQAHCSDNPENIIPIELILFRRGGMPAQKTVGYETDCFLLARAGFEPGIC